MFRKGRREGRGTYSFANGAVYEGRFRDDTIDGMGTFNMPNAVFMPAVAAGRNRTGEDDIYYVSEDAWATDLTVTHRQELC